MSISMSMADDPSERAPMTRKEYWDSRVAEVDGIHPHHLGMTEEQSRTWKILRKLELEAKRAISDFEDSLLPRPLDPAKRERMHDDALDVMCEDRDPNDLGIIVEEMSDREFLDLLSEEDFDTLEHDRNQYKEEAT